MSEDILTRFSELLSELTDASKPLKEVTGLGAISTIAGRNAFVPYEPKVKIFSAIKNGGLIASGLWLNLFILLIGKTRITRKSTVLGFAEDLVKNVNEDLLIVESFTPEALLDELAAREKSGYVNAFLLLDEAARFFEECRRKEYMATAQSLLQRLYDGRDYSRRTKGGGRVYIKNPYFTTIQATTPFVVEEGLITPSDFHHGFLNRFLILKLQPSEYTKDIEFNLQISERLKKEAKEIYDWFEKVYSLPEVKTLALNNEVKKAFWEFDRENRNEINSLNDSVLESYVGNYPEFMLKLAGLYRLAREKDFSRPILPIEIEDWTRAKELLSRLDASVREIRQEIVKKQKTIPFKPEDTSEWEDLVYGIIKAYGKIDRTMLLRKLQKEGINSAGLTTILHELREKGMVNIDTVTLKGPGRSKQIITALK